MEDMEDLKWSCWKQIFGDYDPAELLKRLKLEADKIDVLPKMNVDTIYPTSYKYNQENKCVFLDVGNEDTANINFHPCCCVCEVEIKELFEVLKMAAELYDCFGCFCGTFKQMKEFLCLWERSYHRI